MVVAPKTQNIASLSEFLGPKNLTKSDPSSSCPGASHHSLQPSGSRVSGFTPLFTRPTQTVPAISSAMPVSSAGSGKVDVLRWRVPQWFCGYLWVSMGIHGYLWISMGIYGYLWVSMGQGERMGEEKSTLRLVCSAVLATRLKQSAPCCPRIPASKTMCH